MAVKPFNVAAFTKANFIDPKEVGYRDSIDIINEELQKTRKSFIKIGWYLKHINESNMYTEDGYANIYDFAHDKFNISQPTATRFINLCIEFSVNHDSPELDEQYMEFSVSQLFEMLPMKEEEKEQITPEMTVREIREIKKDSKEKVKEPPDSAIRSFYLKYLKDLSIDERKLLKEHLLLHYGKSHAGGGPEPNYRCTPRGISLNRSDEITWTRFVDRVNKLFPIQDGETKEDDNIPGQTSIEKDFPEYMPDDTDLPSEQDKETVIDGEYREVDESYEEAKESPDTSEEDLRDEIGELIDGIKSVFWGWEGQAIPLEELEMSKKNSLELTIAIEKLMNILK